MVAPFYPMHLRQDNAGAADTGTDTAHIGLTVATVLLILSVIGTGGAANGGWFRIYLYVTIVVLLNCGVWSFMDAPLFAAGLPTPWLGIKERINMYGYMPWLAMLAAILLRADRPMHPERTPDHR